MIKRLAKRGVAAVGKAARRLGLLPRRMVVRMDGGVCSQMHFYLVGEMLRRKGNEVEFDLTWFDEWGKDCDGIHVRNFDLLRMFPSLPFRKASPAFTRLLRLSCPDSYDYFNPPADPLEWISYRGPLYMRGYYHDPEEMYPALFRQIFRPDLSVLDKSGRDWLELIDREADACAVHVRRGDLAKSNPAYGDPATVGYFRRAVERIASMAPGARFFIFSDDPEWCRVSLLPSLPEGVDARIVEGNGSDRGYMDLLLMSCCRHIVCSQGSMGRFAALLRPDALLGGHVILFPGKSSAGWLTRFPDASLL